MEFSEQVHILVLIQYSVSVGNAGKRDLMFAIERGYIASRVIATEFQYLQILSKIMKNIVLYNL